MLLDENVSWVQIPVNLKTAKISVVNILGENCFHPAFNFLGS